MTIFFPDISQYTPVSLAGAPVAIARATISTVTDTHWRSNVDDAGAQAVPLLAYCFLNAGSLGESAEAQADYAFSVAGSRPTMLDHEPNRGTCASLAEACRWIDRYRSHGGVVHLHYLPRWAWSGNLGAPSLAPLADRDVHLVSSNYTAYTDTGPGWAAYGGLTPVQWQYSSTHNFNGVGVDWNAYRGAVADYLTLAAGGRDMNLTDIVPGTGGRDVATTLSDMWNGWMTGHSGFVTNAPLPLNAFLTQLDGKVSAVAAALASAGGHEKADVQRLLDELATLAQTAPAPPDVTALAHGIAADLVAAGDNPLSDADLARVGQIVQDKLAAVLGQVRLTTQQPPAPGA